MSYFESDQNSISNQHKKDSQDLNEINLSALEKRPFLSDTVLVASIKSDEMGYDEENSLLPRSRKSLLGSYRYDSIGSSRTIAEKDDEGKAEGIGQIVLQNLRTVPAALIVACWNIMLSVPFGSMFFSDKVPLPTQTKEKLGLRMNMMALGLAQSIMGGWLSGFEVFTAWELAEVAPFYQDFADLAARSCRDDPSKIYSTTVYLISLSTLCIGVMFMLCGTFHIGKLFSFFPSYVTLGLIAGIGFWAGTISLSVSISSHVFEEEKGESPEWWEYAFTPHFLLSLVLGLGIRPVRKLFPDFILLDPVYFLSIPIVFHIVIAAVGIGFEGAVEAGYMFQEPLQTTDLVDDPPSTWEEAGELWTLFSFSKVNWGVALQAVPQIFAASILGIMIAAPFLPPMATVGSNQGYEPDKEFIAHGITNLIGGLVVPGGVPVCASYAGTVLYVNSGGGGRFCNFLVSCTSFFSFVYGPVVAGYLPRCMAGAILIDMAIALFLEGVADESHKCDPVEYTSIWVILTVMNVLDMTSGLIAGLFMALFTSTFSSSSEDPVRRACTAETFPSSRQRKEHELAILEDPLTGRKKIVIFQLQGSLFFGNISKIQDRLMKFLEKRVMDNIIVIFDCTLVSSLDSSACIFLDKIQSTLQKDYGVAAVVFVASPSKLELEKAETQKKPKKLTRQMSNQMYSRRTSFANETNISVVFSGPGNGSEASKRAPTRRRSTMTTRGSYGRTLQQDIHISGTCFDCLDKALESCEDKLLSLTGIRTAGPPPTLLPMMSDFEDIDNDDPERGIALHMLKDYCKTGDRNLLGSIVDNMKW